MQRIRDLNCQKYRVAVQPALRFLTVYVGSSTVLFFGVGSQFFWFIIFARALGVEAFGHLMVIMAVTALAGTLCGLGSGDAMIRRVSRDQKDYAVMLGHGLILEGVTGVPLMLLATGILYFLVDASHTSVTNLAIMAAYSFSNILAVSFVSFTESVFLAFGYFRRANLVNGAFSAIRLLSAAAACLAFGAHSIGTLAIWTVASHLVACLICTYMMLALGKPTWQVERCELC